MDSNEAERMDLVLTVIVKGIVEALALSAE